MLALAVRGLNFGIDFTGGVVLELSFPQAAELEQVRGSLEKAGFGDAVVQSFGTPRDVLVRMLPEEGTDNSVLGRKVLAAIEADNPGVELRRTEVVGGQVGAELAEKGALAVLFTFFFIMLYVWLRFQWKLGVGAIVAALHDPIIILGIFAATQLTFDLPVLAAILAVIGYSLNDTVVVFDRIRERFLSMRKGTPEQVIDASINETLSRTIMTSFTTMLTVLRAAVLRRRDPARFLDRAHDRHRGRHLLVDLRCERAGARPEADCARPAARAEGNGRRGRHALRGLSSTHPGPGRARDD